MNLIFLHGPPASGKYTIAQGLNEAFGVFNFHNHLTIEVAKSLFDFGTPDFWDLTHHLRRVALAAKASDPDATVVFTNCYSSPQDDDTVSALEDVITSRGGNFLPVYLKCGEDELRRRVVHESRASMRKLHTLDGLEDFMNRWNCVPLERSNCVTVSTEGRDASECVAEIASRLGLESSGPAT